MSSTAESGMVVVLTTVGAATDAAALARTLVEERLAACVSVLPAMLSVYRWKDAVEEDREQQLLIKTLESSVPALEARIRALHTYELPEFIVLRASGGAAYTVWIDASVRRQ